MKRKSDTVKKLESINKNLERVNKRVDVITVILLANSGLKQSEIADILDISEKTVQRMLPFRKIKKKKVKQNEKK